MLIKYQKKFEKKFDKFPHNIQEKINLTIIKFQTNPFDPSLRNHLLQGKMLGRRAISVTNDIRIIFREFDYYVLVIMLDVGTHNQVY